MVKKVLILLSGALLGYLYYRIIGCTTGSCPITSNPYASIFFGILISASFLIPDKKKKADTEK